jgi:hypothetical protein
MIDHDACLNEANSEQLLLVPFDDQNLEFTQQSNQTNALYLLFLKKIKNGTKRN